MSKILASLVVSREEGAYGAISIELDSENNLDSSGEQGNTSFAPGDEINFLIHHDSTIRISQVSATDGQIVTRGELVQERTDSVTLVDQSDTHTLQYTPTGAITETWYGNNATPILLNGERVVYSNSSILPALCELSFNVTFKSFRLLTPVVELDDGEVYHIIIVVYVESV